MYRLKSGKKKKRKISFRLHQDLHQSQFIKVKLNF